MLTLYTCWEMPRIESLEQMEKLSRVELRANKGSAIGSCIKSIQNWPDEIMICTRAVSDASSLVDSLLSPNLSVVDSFSNKDFGSRSKLLCNRFINRNAIMLCYVINSIVSLRMKIDLECCEQMIYGEDEETAAISSMGIDEGTWVLIVVFTQRSQWLRTEHLSRPAFSISADEQRGRWAAEVERGLAVRGEEQSLVQAICHLIH